MTIQEIHIAFAQELDKTQTFEYPSFQPEQIDYWLNKAQLEVIDGLAYPVDSRFPGFENGQRRIDELKDIIVPSGNLTPVQMGTDFEVELPNDYFHLVRHRCVTNDTNCGNKTTTVPGVQTKQDFIGLQLKDPFNKPTASEPLYYIIGNTIVYETLGDFTISSTNITYIKEPAKMRLGVAYTIPTTNVECDFNSDDMQHKIIDKAVSMVLENIESPRYQTNLNELNN